MRTFRSFIIWRTAIAALNAPAALGWLLGYQNDAVRMQQPSWMSYYNGSWLLGTPGRPSLPKGFWNVVGTDVTDAYRTDEACAPNATAHIIAEPSLHPVFLFLRARHAHRPPAAPPQQQCSGP